MVKWGFYVGDFVGIVGYFNFGFWDCVCWFGVLGLV